MFKKPTNRKEVVSLIMLLGTLFSFFMYVVLELATYTIGIDAIGFFVKIYAGFMCLAFVMFYIDDFINRLEKKGAT